MAASLRILALLALCVLASAGTLIINEVDVDNVGTDTAEYVELRNMGCSTLDLTGYHVDLLRNTDTVNPYQSIALSGTVASGGYYVICTTNSAVANCNLKVTPVAGCGASSGPCINLIFNTNGDGVRLKDNTGATLDQLSYGAYTSGLSEGSAGTPADSNTNQGSISRCPNGQDTNQNGNDFAFTSTISPGTANSCSQASITPSCSGTTPAPTTAPATPAPTTAPATPGPTTAPATPGPTTAPATNPPATPVPGPTVAAGFDFFYMVNQWPGGWPQAFCAESSWPRGAYWTLHGMWPNYNTGGYPSSCNTEVFDPNQISSIITDMDRYWPSFKCSSGTTPAGDNTFWDHEWSKHGTCAETVLTSQLKYFSGVINLRKNVIGDLAPILAAKGINPGGSYTISAIQSAVSAAIGHVPYVNCNPSTAVLAEIWVCVSNTASLQLIDCPVFPAASCTSTTVTYNSFS